MGPITPKQHGKPASIRYQKTRPANKIENLAKSAKPRSPVQIWAAPPNSLRNLIVLELASTAWPRSWRRRTSAARDSRATGRQRDPSGGGFRRAGRPAPARRRRRALQFATRPGG